MATSQAQKTLTAAIKEDHEEVCCSAHYLMPLFMHFVRCMNTMTIMLKLAETRMLRLAGLGSLLGKLLDMP